MFSKKSYSGLCDTKNRFSTLQGEVANDKSHVENKGTTIFNKSNQSNEVFISGGKFWQITLIADAMGNRLALERTATATLLNDGYSRVKPIRRLIKDQRNMYIIPDASMHTYIFHQYSCTEVVGYMIKILAASRD